MENFIQQQIGENTNSIHGLMKISIYGAAVGMQHMKVYWVATSHSLSIFPLR